MGTQPCVILAAPRGFHRVVRDCPDNGFQLIAEPWVFRGHAVDGMPGPASHDRPSGASPVQYPAWILSVTNTGSVRAQRKRAAAMRVRRAACAGSRSMTTPAGSGGPSGRRPMTIRAQPRPPWSTPWKRRPVPRRATVHRIGLIGLIGNVTVRAWPADGCSSRSADRHRDDKHDRETRNERALPTQPTVL